MELIRIITYVMDHVRLDKGGHARGHYLGSEVEVKSETRHSSMDRDVLLLEEAESLTHTSGVQGREAFLLVLEKTCLQRAGT